MTDNVESAGDSHRYDPVDDDEMAQCVRCGVTFGTEDRGAIANEVNLTYGPVVRPGSGRTVDCVFETDYGTELVHPDCYEKMETNRRRDENVSLMRWAQ